VEVLSDYFGRRMAAELGWERWPGFAPHVAAEMAEYAWPGNVRELRNAVERAVYRWDDWSQPVGHIQFDPFESPWKPANAPAPAAASVAPELKLASTTDLESISDLRSAVDAHERAILVHALGRHRWNQRQTARALGLTYDQLRHCIRKHSLADAGEQAA
jgi:psp operon transcriptional activator